MSVRLNRLQSEYERLMLLFEHHPHIRIVETAGRPPDRYTIEYHLKGLVQESEGIQTREVHRARILLDQDYPRTMPRCIMLTAVFHPNIDHLAICTEDIGAAGQTIDQLIVFIGEMICYQAYNVQSPRNGEAAQWARDHADDFPLENIDLTPAALMKDEPLAVMATRRAGEIEFCQNCGASGAGVALQRCVSGHLACPDCGLICANCRNPVCVVCQVIPCHACRRAVCSDCHLECASCGHSFCLEHIGLCPICHRYQCAPCAEGCTAQGGREETLVSAPPPLPEATSALTIGEPAPAVAFEELQAQLVPVEPMLAAAEPEPLPVRADEPAVATRIVETVPAEPISSAPVEEAAAEAAIEPSPVEAQQPVPAVVIAAPVTQTTPVHRWRAPIYLSADEVALVPESSIPRPTRYLRVAPEPKKQTSGKAITALVFGIVGLPVLGILVGWFALLFALLAMRDLRADSSLTGRGMATAGLALGIVDLALWIALLAFYLAPGPRHFTPSGQSAGPQIRPAMILGTTFNSTEGRA